MKFSFKKNVLLLLLCFGLSNSQILVPYYKTVVDQCLQTNITSNLTQFEALGVKRRGTAELQNTLDWLKNKYTSFGYASNQLQEYSYTYSGSTAVCKNLVVTKIGTLYPNTFLIVCGHYDSLVGTGTNDNGSGVACILESARLLVNIPTEYSIKFINFSGEEDGLKGSQNFVSSVVNATTPKMNIRLVFNLDEVGGVASLTNDTITCERDTSTPTTNNAASNTFTNELITCVGLYSPLNTYLSYCYASDYMSFQSNNDVITGLFETNETTVKHTANDFLVNMDPVYNFKVAKAVIGATLHFAKAATVLKNENFENEFNISFFPNPAKDSLTLSLGNLIANKISFSLVDILGKKVITKEISGTDILQTIDTKNLNSGVYLAVLEFDGKLVSQKIVLD